MARFNMDQVRNQVATTYVSKPKSIKSQEEMEAITFTLKPVDSHINLLCRRLRFIYEDQDNMLFSIGAARIKGWSGVQDEHGTDIPFNDTMFAQWANLPEAVEYLLDIGKHTAEEVLGSTKTDENTKKKPVETLPTNSETSEQS